MIFKKGQTVTAASLTLIFKELKRGINEIISSSISSITTGQILDKAVWNQGSYLYVSPMSNSNEQYFDTAIIPAYYIGVNSDIPKGNNAYLYYYIRNISDIDSLLL